MVVARVTAYHQAHATLLVLICIVFSSVSVPIANDTVESDKGKVDVSARELYDQYLNHPSMDNYLRVREAIRTDSSYAPFGNAINEMRRLAFEGKSDSVLQVYSTSQPDLLLSPSAHRLLRWHTHNWAMTGRHYKSKNNLRYAYLRSC